jgi:hypothetical protein
MMRERQYNNTWTYQGQFLTKDIHSLFSCFNYRGNCSERLVCAVTELSVHYFFSLFLSACNTFLPEGVIVGFEMGHWVLNHQKISFGATNIWGDPPNFVGSF